MIRVLIAEDEPRLGLLLAEAMEAEGWEAELCTSGHQAVAAATASGHDVLLLDWMLPGLEGPEVIAHLREAGNSTPVMLLTARYALADRIEGLDAGADDYLSKPFELDELLARVRALHRRANGVTSPIRRGDVWIDPRAHRAGRGEVVVTLSAREFEILHLLARRAGEVVTRSMILEQIWDGDADLRSNVIDAHIKALRSKIDKPFGRRAIETVRNVGYRFERDGG